MGKTLREFRFFSKTLNGRLPLSLRSVRLENLGKRVSDDSQHLIFRHQKFFVRHFVCLRHKFSPVFTRFLRSYAKTDLAKRFPAKFCFRCTYYHLCTTKIHRKHVHVTLVFAVSIVCAYLHTCFVFPIYLGHWR